MNEIYASLDIVVYAVCDRFDKDISQRLERGLVGSKVIIMPLEIWQIAQM